ncbi:clavesin-2 [Neodiprion pinetum]|uniref:Clavesin-2 n=1 Tax=Neodiprion lecontei TaxID=441921 RepID=A0A6J0B5D3_NEOLC|nr:clavesin-2 [Neodiprion lecontei]XP_015509378.1 clavesin-2 [Neodiprion lecontei]XP_046419350.1 clavesin-2 [Neodiprion fabricii]XP_046419351.1 clavesin-2 [Neodiprion fabricii]XP_046419352.1 clavesin-2 [Neodiprion fabricii]XP_046474741.1 clavesin-2 [Neodiprion pinetum]XP_046474743.1 clavesin-2 [Neodiprion pinetum]XP_046474744.1 clavesin-2 [Neodiprion pinetum]XP_046590049.1 clavesin-2 [Neodiprion lecontei]XP_046609075.1 clavesin-2 [Neodiprion virginianus]XP_046609076.1 clavesin-2 [Neodipri
MGMGGQHQVEGYECGLSPETQTAARVELREDEKTREHALSQLRHWILKHPKIKNCRTDAVFLLRFLRTKKFSVPLAQDMLERYLTIRQLYPNWFQNLDIKDPAMEAIIDSGYLVPLPQRDRLGRQVILSCAGRFDPYKFTSAQMARAHSLVVETLMDEEENQVHGYSHVNDESGLTMGHLSAWSLTDIRNMLRCIQNSTPMRHKETHFINIPSYATKIIEFAVSLLNDKLKGRVLVHKNLDELKLAVDPKILPKEYGGEIPMAEMIATFKTTLHAKRDELKALDDMYIELSSKDNCTSTTSDGLGGISGSFRKLEVD